MKLNAASNIAMMELWSFDFIFGFQVISAKIYSIWCSSNEKDTNKLVYGCFCEKYKLFQEGESEKFKVKNHKAKMRWKSQGKIVRERSDLSTPPNFCYLPPPPPPPPPHRRVLSSLKTAKWQHIKNLSEKSHRKNTMLK